MHSKSPFIPFSSKNLHLILRWAEKFSHFVFLNSNNYHIKRKTIQEGYKNLIAIGVKKELKKLTNIKFNNNSNFNGCFGFLNYDLKNEFEVLPNVKGKRFDFPAFYFFEPQYLMEFDEEWIYLLSPENLPANEIELLKEEVLQSSLESLTHALSNPTVQQRLSLKEYVAVFNKLQQHIKNGDIYEINFCQEFFIENAQIDPMALFFSLIKLSPMPFSAYMKWNDQYLISASPERFLKKEGDKIFSQPMKGTMKRDADPQKDAVLKHELEINVKERAENIMITDLVRNDLSKIAKKSSVQVDELCGVYSFPKVHQMISTISATLKEDLSFWDILKATFPMGSMTGAPKIRAMELIDAYEPVNRSLFSGSIGYISSNGDFDFNVIIRSILYNSSTQYLSFSTGSAITSKSEALQEYEECMLKAAMIQKALSMNGNEAN